MQKYEIARSLGESNEIRDGDDDGDGGGAFEKMSGPDIDTNIPQYYKYHLSGHISKDMLKGEKCEELLNTRGNENQMSFL